MSETLPTFFLDRSLGKRMVADALRSLGAEVLLMAEVFPNDGQSVSDPTWIRRCGSEGWVALTKDSSARLDHRQDMDQAALRLFVLTNANLTGEENAERIRTNWPRIAARARQPGPYVSAVLPSRLERR